MRPDGKPVDKRVLSALHIERARTMRTGMNWKPFCKMLGASPVTLEIAMAKGEVRIVVAERLEAAIDRAWAERGKAA